MLFVQVHMYSPSSHLLSETRKEESGSSCFHELLCREILLNSRPFQAYIQYIFYSGSPFGKQRCSHLYSQHWLLEQDLEDQWCIAPPCCKRPVWALEGTCRAMVTNADWSWFIMAPAFGYGASLLVAKKLSKSVSLFPLFSCLFQLFELASS